MDRGQSNLFRAVNQKYCIDTSAIKDFWDTTPRTRPYHVKVQSFRKLWEYLASQVANETVIVPTVVSKEIIIAEAELRAWLKTNKSLFVAHSDCLNELGSIVKDFQIYTKKDRASLNDAIVIAVAMKHNLTVITSESHTSQHSLIRPKIPNVCEHFGVKWVNLPEYFEAEGL